MGDPPAVFFLICPEKSHQYQPTYLRAALSSISSKSNLERRENVCNVCPNTHHNCSSSHWTKDTFKEPLSRDNLGIFNVTLQKGRRCVDKEDRHTTERTPSCILGETEPTRTPTSHLRKPQPNDEWKSFTQWTLCLNLYSVCLWKCRRRKLTLKCIHCQ